MRGVHFVTNTEGKKVAVQLDLDEWGEVWEEIHDAMLARERMGEETIPLEEVERDLREKGRLA